MGVVFVSSILVAAVTFMGWFFVALCREGKRGQRVRVVLLHSPEEASSARVSHARTPLHIVQRKVRPVAGRADNEAVCIANRQWRKARKR